MKFFLSMHKYTNVFLPIDIRPLRFEIKSAPLRHIKQLFSCNVKNTFLLELCNCYTFCWLWMIAVLMRSV